MGRGGGGGGGGGGRGRGGGGGECVFATLNLLGYVLLAPMSWSKSRVAIIFQKVFFTATKVYSIFKCNIRDN